MKHLVVAISLAAAAPAYAAEFDLVPGTCGPADTVIAALARWKFSMVYNVVDDETARVIQVWETREPRRVYVTFENPAARSMCVLSAGTAGGAVNGTPAEIVLETRARMRAGKLP